MMYPKASILGLLMATFTAAFAQNAEFCNLAVVSQRVSPNTKVCDSKRVAEMARQGHVYEQNQMGLAATLVVGPGSDIKNAVEWFQKAAQRGYAPAQVNLAVLYLNGWGVSQNYGIAQRWFREAADRHFAPAYYNLGEMYFKGMGVPQDNAEALRFFRLAAEAGDSYAQTNLGYMYDRGLSVKSDLATAAQWYRRAADAGNPLAQSNLADLYARGESVPHDEAMAFHLFQQAAQKGHTGAQIQVAYRLASGVGTSKNEESALTWVTAAVLAGDNRGQDLLQSLQLQLKPDQVKRAREAAANLRASAEITAKAAILQP